MIISQSDIDHLKSLSDESISLLLRSVIANVDRYIRLLLQAHRIDPRSARTKELSLYLGYLTDAMEVFESIQKERACHENPALHSCP